MLDASNVCKQCGWDRSQDGPPTQNPGDQKARLGVAAGLVVAYGVLSFLISSTDASARPVRASRPPAVAVEEPAYAPEPVTSAPVALGTLPSTRSIAPTASSKPGAALTIQIAESKSTTIPARDALPNLFHSPAH